MHQKGYPQGFQPGVPERNGFAHWFDRSSTSTTEDGFWSSAYTFGNVAPELLYLKSGTDTAERTRICSGFKSAKRGFTIELWVAFRV